MRETNGETLVERQMGDVQKSRKKNFFKTNDAQSKSLNPNVEKTVQKMFDLNDQHIRTDGNGKFFIYKNKDGERTGKPKVYDLNNVELEVKKGIEYNAKRYFMSEHLDIPVEDLNNIREVNGNYHYEDRDGVKHSKEPSKEQRDNIDQDLSSLGLENIKRSIPDSIGEGVIDHAIKQANKKDNADVELETYLKNGIVYDYSYDQQNKKHTFNIVSKHEKGYGHMMAVSVDLKSLPPEVKNGLIDHEKKYVLAKEAKLDEKNIDSLSKVNGEFHYQTPEGRDLKVELSPDRIKKINEHLSSLGLEENKQISDFIGKNVIKHAIEKDADLKAYMQDKIEKGHVYDYHYDKTKEEPHVFYIMKREKIDEEMTDREPITVSFNEQEYREIRRDAELNIARKYIKELPNGKQVAGVEVEDAVTFDPKDDTKYLVKTADGGECPVSREGEDWSKKIQSELAITPGGQPDNLPVKMPDANNKTMLDGGGPDDEVELKKRSLERLKKYLKLAKRTSKTFAVANDAGSAAAQSFDQLAALLLQSQGSAPNTVPPGSQVTHAVDRSFHKHVKQKIEKKEKEIVVLEKRAKAGGGTLESRNIQLIEDETKRLGKSTKKTADSSPNSSPNSSTEHQDEDTSSQSSESSESSEEADRYQQDLQQGFGILPNY